MLVVMAHSSYLLPEEVRKIVRYFEFDGVTLFFVLSGFLIGGILIRLMEEKGMRIDVLWKFWLRRWFRTLPAYFLVLLMLCTLHLLFNENFTLKSVSRYFVFSQNLFAHYEFSFFQEAWSLSVEEWFYVLFPVLLGVIGWTVKISAKRVVAMACLLVAVAVTAFRLYRYATMPVTDEDQLTLMFGRLVVTRLDSLMYGVFGAYLYQYHHQAWIQYKKPWLIGGILMVAVTKYVLPLYTPPIGVYTSVFSYTLISISALMLMPFFSQMKTYSGLLFKPITYISLMSYSMYLVHFSIVRRWIVNRIDWSYFTENHEMIILLKLGTFWVLVFVFSFYLYKYFERPMTKWRERFT